MVIDGAGVVQRRPAAGGDAPREARLLQRVEPRVDSRQRDIRKPARDCLEDVIGAGVAVELAQRLVNRQSLRGHAVSARPQGRDGGIGCGSGLLHRSNFR
jgi:hypothetical protein